MKRLFILLTISILSLNCIAQKNTGFTENDVKQFYRTIQGDYTGKIGDSIDMALHFTPIWEKANDRFHWLYLEVVKTETKEIVLQKILEIQPLTDITFKVVVHGIKKPQRFEGKWHERNFFDGFNTSILRGKSKFVFLKTKDFEYQTNWKGRKGLKCFPAGDKIHIKFVQEDERCYIQRVPKRSTRIFGTTFFKALTD